MSVLGSICYYSRYLRSAQGQFYLGIQVFTKKAIIKFYIFLLIRRSWHFFYITDNIVDSYWRVDVSLQLELHSILFRSKLTHIYTKKEKDQYIYWKFFVDSKSFITHTLDLIFVVSIFLFKYMGVYCQQAVCLLGFNTRHSNVTLFNTVF